MKRVLESPGVNAELCGPGGCHSFQSKKKRYCKMVVRAGALYCGAHCNEGDPIKKRVPCPHCGCLVPSEKLDKHVTKCNKVKEAAIIPNYYELNINAESDMEQSDVDGRKLSDFKKELVEEVLSELRKVSDPITEEINEIEYEEMSSLLTNLRNNNATKALRHSLQQSLIIAHMNSKNLLQSNYCYIELGAGKGGLTERINQDSNLSNLEFIIVDRATSRVKKERKIEKNSFERVKIDIKDFDINMINSTKKQVGIAKHLCGSATDLSLRGIQRSSKLSGIVIATCCHHKCAWTNFHSRDFLGPFKNRTYFRILTLLSSWRTCGFEKKRNEGINEESITEKSKFDLTVEEKEAIGSKAKYVIDKARCDYLKVKFPTFRVHLEQYCSMKTTPECRLILMTE